MECEQEMVMAGSSDRGVAVVVAPAVHPPAPLYVISTSTANELVPAWMAADPARAVPTISVWWDYPPS